MARRAEKIAPKTAMPNEPPTERKNVAAEVATPRSPRPRVLHRYHQHLDYQAQAEPEHEEVEIVTTVTWSPTTCDSSYIHTASSPVPTIGKIL